MKKFLSILLTIIMAFSVSIFAVGCDELLSSGAPPSGPYVPPDTPGTTPEEPGTTPEEPETPDEPETPVVDTATPISTEAELRAIANNLAGEYALTQNITLTSEWNTIGSETAPFTGILDGRGFTISGANIVSTVVNVDYQVGFIGVLKGKLKNLTFDGFEVSVISSSINGIDYANIKAQNPAITDLNVNVGVVAVNKGNIKDVIVNDANISVIPQTSTARVRAGVLAGRNNDKIESCSASGTLSVVNIDGHIRAGGIAGYVSSNGKILDNRAQVSVSASITTDAKMQVGGLVGNLECGIVTGNYASCTVTATSEGIKSVIAGGLIGKIDNKEATKYPDMSVTVSGNWVSGSAIVTASEGYSAGLIGKIDFDQTVNTNTNLITITDNQSSARGNSQTSFGLIRSIMNQLDAIIGSTSFTNGKYGVITITGNQSVVPDGHATTIESLTLPSKWQ
ncbi:MAG: hypothetical protein IKC64_01180 [Clostridia bacterium]|nr:hypothetical protein [Clostridia bacterium]